MRVHTLGAYDRFNFGDLCFPHVWDARFAVIRPAGELTHCGLSAADMRSSGGHLVVDVRHAFADPVERSRARVVIGGGELLGAGWFGMLSSLSSHRAAVARRLRRLPRGARERLARTVMRAPWEYPFLLDPAAFGRIAYSSLGASHSVALSEAEQAQRWRRVAGAAYVSVRDGTSLELARAHGVGARLVPDSVAGLLELPLFRHVRESAVNPEPGRRVVIQASRQWVTANRRAAAKALTTLADTGVALRFLPVGLAPGHADEQGLASLISAVRGDVEVVPVTTVTDIVSALCSADVVVASSLHATIVAMAAGRPHVGLTGVQKLTSYLATWAIPSSSTPANAGELVGRVLHHLDNPQSDERLALAGRLARLAADDSATVVRAVVGDG